MGLSLWLLLLNDNQESGTAVQTEQKSAAACKNSVKNVCLQTDAPHIQTHHHGTLGIAAHRIYRTSEFCKFHNDHDNDKYGNRDHNRRIDVSRKELSSLTIRNI